MDGETRYCIAGYATIYQYYAYPANTRPRISQALILPPFQRKGLGSRLLNTIYRQYFKDDKVVDITGKKLIEINEPNIVLHFPHCMKIIQNVWQHCLTASFRFSKTLEIEVFLIDLFIQNVDVARFARNVEWDSLRDFQTLWVEEFMYSTNVARVAFCIHFHWNRKWIRC